MNDGRKENVYERTKRNEQPEHQLFNHNDQTESNLVAFQ